jgi:VanZ family protein
LASFELFGGRMPTMNSSQSTPLIVRWIPAGLMMALIFFISSRTSSQLPYFGEIDVLIKKGGHAIGYAMLALAYFTALPPRLSIGYRIVMAFFMTILFALSDEFHQSFVEGRTSSLRDVVIDSLGAITALTFGGLYSSNSRSNSAD